MHPVLNRNLYLVKEHLVFFKAANNFDIYDPQTNEQIPAMPQNRAVLSINLVLKE